MSEVYDRWPQIATDNFSTNFSKVDIKNIDHVVFAGMGGSGTIGDVFASILSKTDIHVSVVKGYLLPKTVDDSTLVCLLYTSPSPRDRTRSRMPSSA